MGPTNTTKQINKQRNRKTDSEHITTEIILIMIKGK